jgi:hypothetical protein
MQSSRPAPEPVPRPAAPAPEPVSRPAAGQSGRPRTLAGAAAVQAVQAAGLFYAAVLAAVDSAGGKSSNASTGVALAVLGAVTAAGLGYTAAGLARARRWSRAPALITQLLTGLVSFYLIQSQRYEWGVPGLVLAVAGFVLLLVPPSLRALGLRQPEPSAPARPGK